jgi:hypothetical protein
MMAIAQPFAMCALFGASGVVCLLKRGWAPGLGVVGVGFLLMAIGEPFLGLARLKPDFILIGNYVQGTTLPLGALVALVGLVLARPVND